MQRFFHCINPLLTNYTETSKPSKFCFLLPTVYIDSRYSEYGRFTVVTAHIHQRGWEESWEVVGGV